MRNPKRAQGKLTEDYKEKGVGNALHLICSPDPIFSARQVLVSFDT